MCMNVHFHVYRNIIMQLSITLTQDPNKSYLATDLGFLLHKNPNNPYKKDLKFGIAHVFYPTVTDEECTACLYVDIDSIDLVRNYQGPNSRRELKQYVNDRPYAVNSFLTVAMSRIFGTALAGTCNQKEALVTRKLPFSIEIPVLPSRGGSQLITELFEPLGYTVEATPLVYDEAITEWGNSPYYKVKLKGEFLLADLLKHLYILIPVLDDEKHYWVGEDEVEKLIRHGSDWVSEHPNKHLIVSRYLKKQGNLRKQALKQLALNEEDVSEIQNNEVNPTDDAEVVAQKGEAKLEKALRLNDLRIKKIVETIQEKDVSSIIDFGCGEGRYLREYLKLGKLKQVTGVEVSPGELLKAEQRLRIDRLPEKISDKLQLLQGSLTYFDKRTKGYDLATCIEVIEHIDEERLDAFKASLFAYASPRNVIITTPNVEYNRLFENMSEGKLRHSDHRFEWDRATFIKWCEDIASQFSYSVKFDGIGHEDPELGAPTQMASFQKK